jgi:hypothetical protein
MRLEEAEAFWSRLATERCAAIFFMPWGYRFQTQLVVVEADEAQPAYCSAGKKLHASLGSLRGYAQHKYADKGGEKNGAKDDLTYEAK